MPTACSATRVGATAMTTASSSTGMLAAAAIARNGAAGIAGAIRNRQMKTRQMHAPNEAPRVLKRTVVSDSSSDCSSAMCNPSVADRRL
eukprot:5747543-Prymnesium_polylepis.1